MIAPEGFGQFRSQQIIDATMREINRAPITPFSLIVAATAFARIVRKAIADNYTDLDPDQCFREAAEQLDAAEARGEVLINATLTLAIPPDKEPPKEC